jgi:DNA-binding MarR family transcriptional regulator
VAQQPAPDPPLARLLGLSLGAITGRLHERLIAAGFSDHRMSYNAVLPHIPPAGITLAELARRAGITKQAMSELVQDLEAKGYVSRRADPADRRLKIIEFTARGWQAVEAALAAFADIEQELQAVLGRQHLVELRQMLAQIIDAVPGPGAGTNGRPAQ